MQEIHKSTFTGGRSVDIDRSILQSNNYVEGRNIILTGGSSFLSAENIKGTLDVGAIKSSFSGEVLGVYSNKYNIDGTVKDCLTVFTVETTDIFNIYCYDTQSNTSYHLYTETNSGYAASNPVIDAVVYPESGIDILYFVDGFNEIRRLRCEITGYSPAFLTAADLSLQRRQPRGGVVVSSVADGGSLLCGSYVVTHRLINTTTNTYSKWSPFTAPIHITQADLSTSPQSHQNNGEIGTNSTQKITLSIDVSTAEEALYTHYQLGVIERTATTLPTVLALKTLSTLDGSETYSDSILDNTQATSIDLADVVIDDAPIKSAKTIQVKNNKLFAGNIEYYNLEFDAPSVTGTIVRKTDIRDFFSKPTNFSKYKGYFRDEVYRFGVVYFDKYGNYSKVKVLDMRGVTGNASSVSDMKFPSRRTKEYNVFDNTATTNIVSLGLSLTVNDHPSWAVGFIIVRAPRKKNIVTQTPLIPMSELNGVEVIGDYPSSGVDISNPALTVDFTGATPMSAVGTLAPKNYFWNQDRHLVKNTSDTNPKQVGEVMWGTTALALVAGQTGSPNAYGGIFPQDSMLTGNGFEDRAYNYELTDIAWLRLKSSRVSGTYTDGDYADTDVHGTFYADSGGDYYAAGTTFTLSSAPTPNPTGKIIDYKFVENGAPSTIGNYFLQDYNKLITGGVTAYTEPPTTLRMGAVKFESSRTFSVEEYGVNGSVGLLSPPSGQSINSLFFTGTTRNSAFPVDTTTYTESTQYAGAVEIVNITKGLADTRYGDSDDTYEFISTGTVYHFSDAEIATNQSGSAPAVVEVFGGDCTVSLHSFKLTDSYFGASHNTKFTTGVVDVYQTVATKWKRTFSNKHDKPISNPVPFKNCSTVLSVVLESEYNAAVQDPTPLGTTTGNNSFRIPYSTDRGVRRVPFSYGYNNNYNIENIEKVFVPTFTGERLVASFPARGIYSDQKVYQTGINGFDRIRSGNIFDLEETYGGITKLALAGDNLIAIQDKATAYVPVDADVIETADATTLAIRSSEVTGVPIYISRLYGSSHTKSAITLDKSVIFADNRNEVVLKLSGQDLEIISEKGAIGTFNNWLGTSIPKNELYAGYDSIKRHYWLFSKTQSEGDNMMCEVWDDRLGVWIGQFEFTTAAPLCDMVTANNAVYVIGDDGTDLNTYKMYEGDYSSLCGATVTPSIKFVVNDKFELPKTFDNFVVYASDKLATVTIQAEKEPGVVGNEVSGIVLAKDRREGSYRVQIPYDVNNARVRGTRADVTVIWDTTDKKVSLSGVATKYRISNMDI